jgi:hypothetical protein
LDFSPLFDPLPSLAETGYLLYSASRLKIMPVFFLGVLCAEKDGQKPIFEPTGGTDADRSGQTDDRTAN